MSTQLLPGQAMLIQASGRAPTAHISNQGPGLLVVTQQDNSLEFRLGAPGSADVPIKESLRVTNGSAERTSLSVTVSGAEATEIKAPVSGSK